VELRCWLRELLLHIEQRRGLMQQATFGVARNAQYVMRQLSRSRLAFVSAEHFTESLERERRRGRLLGLGTGKRDTRDSIERTIGHVFDVNIGINMSWEDAQNQLNRVLLQY